MEQGKKDKEKSKKKKSKCEVAVLLVKFREKFFHPYE